VNKRWSLPNGSFEWFAKMDTVTLKRMNIQVLTVYVYRCASGFESNDDDHLETFWRRRPTRGTGDEPDTGLEPEMLSAYSEGA
jgi:hypothetical protein